MKKGNLKKSSSSKDTKLPKIGKASAKANLQDQKEKIWQMLKLIII